MTIDPIKWHNQDNKLMPLNKFTSDTTQKCYKGVDTYGKRPSSKQLSKSSKKRIEKKKSNTLNL